MVISRMSDGRIEEVNESFVDITGFTREEAVGRTSVELGILTPGDRGKLLSVLGEPGRVPLKEIPCGTRWGHIPMLVSAEVLDLDDGDDQYLMVTGTDVSELRSVEERLRLSQFIVDEALEPVYLVRADGSLDYVNQAVTDLLRYSREELLSMRVTDLDQDVTPKEWNQVWNTLRERGELRIRRTHRTRSGERIPLDFIFRHLAFEGVEYSVCLGRDIRDDLEKDRAVRESRERYECLVENLPALVWSSTPEGDITFMSSMSERILGYAPEEFMDEGLGLWEKIVHPGDWQDFMEARRLTVQEGIPVTAEVRARSKRGDWKWLQVKGAFLDREGVVRTLYAITSDISTEKTAQESLAESEAEFRALFENAPLGILKVNRQGRVLGVNPVMVEMLGLRTPGDLLGRNLVDDLGLDLEKKGGEVTLLSAFGPVQGETTWRRNDGKTLRVRLTGRPLVSPAAPDVFLEVFVEDVTAQRNLEAQLQQAQKLETLGTLASGIAHDFNNLLVPILGYADLARSGLSPENPLRKVLEGHLYDAAERAKNLVQQILTFTRKNQPRREALHPEQPVKQALQFVEVTLPSSIQLKRKIVEPVGLILADTNQLQQVVVNLCTNAIQAMGEAGGRLQVTLRRRELDDRTLASLPELEGRKDVVNLVVADTGPGIPLSNLGQIFDPFFTTKKEGEGTGLGLSVVFGIVKSHGGAIRVDSAPGEGATFRLYFPMAKNLEEEAEAASGPLPGGTEHVLVVDDEEQSGETGRQLLRSMGYRVSLAASGMEALEIFSSDPHSIDIVLADYDMRGMTGTHLSLELSEVRSDIPVLLVSGLDRTGVLEAENWGIRGHLSKPFTAAELNRAIRQVLDEPNVAVARGD
jgi:PAS domain S-box-containing protein